MSQWTTLSLLPLPHLLDYHYYFIILFTDCPDAFCKLNNRIARVKEKYINISTSVFQFKLWPTFCNIHVLAVIIIVVVLNRRIEIYKQSHKYSFSSYFYLYCYYIISIAVVTLTLPLCESIFNIVAIIIIASTCCW